MRAPIILTPYTPIYKRRGREKSSYGCSLQPELGSYSIVSRMTSMEPEYSLSVKQRDDIKDISAEESAEEHPEASWTANDYSES